MAIFNGTSSADVINLSNDPTANQLNGLEGNDTLTGGAGNDTLDGGTGDDSMTGGAGNDTYIVDSLNDKVIELSGGGNDTVKASVSFSVATLTQVENITLTGTAHINATGNSLNNNLIGNDGNNLLDGGRGRDLMIGGLGNDTYVVDNTGDVVIEGTGTGTDKILSSISLSLVEPAGGTGVFGEVENLTLTGTAAIDATGNHLANFLTGNAADNVIMGGGGNDSVSAEGGNDILVGENGNDVMMGGQGDDILAGGSGTDFLLGGDGKDQFDGGTGGDQLHGGAGNDVYLFQDNFGPDTVRDTDTTAGNIDELHFQSVDYNRLWFTQTGNDLVVSVVGSSVNKVTVQAWFTGAQEQVELICDNVGGHQLSAQNVAGLVSAMSGFAPQDMSSNSNATLTAARDQAWITL